MTYRPRRRCRRCDRDRAVAGGMSRSGLCPACGPVVLAESLEQLASHRGPAYDAWLQGITDAVASLWGERHIPPAPDDALVQGALFEEDEWPDGLTGHQATQPTGA